MKRTICPSYSAIDVVIKKMRSATAQTFPNLDPLIWIPELAGDGEQCSRVACGVAFLASEGFAYPLLYCVDQMEFRERKTLIFCSLECMLASVVIEGSDCGPRERRDTTQTLH